MNPSLAILFALTAAAASIAPAAQAASQPMPFSYRVKVPASATSCADHAGTVAANFASGTRAKSVSGACESRQTFVDQNTQYSIDVIVVNYLADSELTPNRSVFGANAFLNKGEQAAGVFLTYSDCLAQLAIQQPVFATETGATPLVAYCTASTQQEFFPGYSLTFETFGDLARQLYTFSEDGIGVPTDDHSQTIHAAVSAIRAAGGDISWSDANRVFYYNNGDINVASENLGMFEEAQQCTSQVSQAQAIYTAAGMVGVSSFCRTFAPVAGHSYSILMAVGAGPNEISDLESDHYTAFDECVGDLNRILSNAASSGRTVLGGLCLPNETGNAGFNAHVYSDLSN